MKHLKKIIIGAGAAFLCLSAAVLSQTISLPQVSVINPTDLIQIIPFGQPTAQSVYVPPSKISNTYGYYKSPASAPASGFVYTYANNVTYASFTPSGTIAYGYMVVNQAPSDGTRNCAFTTQAITTFLVCSASSSGACTQTNINNSVSTLAANTGVCYLYSASNQTWDRD